MHYKQHVSFVIRLYQRNNRHGAYFLFFFFSLQTFDSDVTEHLQLLLRKGGYNFHTTAEKEVVRMIKEKMCYVAINPTKEEKDTGGKCDDFVLPDGNVVKVIPYYFG